MPGLTIENIPVDRPVIGAFPTIANSPDDIPA
jgi:hypothetical protein